MEGKPSLTTRVALKCTAVTSVPARAYGLRPCQQ